VRLAQQHRALRAAKARAIGAAIAIGLALGWSACAAERPEPDSTAASCDASADCAGPELGAVCGFVRLCIAGRCEAVDDAGAPVSETATCATRP
jgi:hypothetical protein